MADEAKEKCAVTGAIVDSGNDSTAAALNYEMLYALQHRGAEATGMASLSADGTIESRRELGMVRDVYREKDIRRLAGDIAIGHNRYSTSGSKLKHSQPFKDPVLGFAFAHNGNLPVTDHLETMLHAQRVKVDQFNDSEMMGLAIAQYIRNGQDLPSAVRLAAPYFRGAYSSVAMHDDILVAFRDSKGIRPLEIGSIEDGYVVASETCGLDIINAKHEHTINPGEMAVISKNGIEYEQLAEGTPKLDMFEFVYFARHDSELYGQRVNEVRRRMGQQLAIEHPLSEPTDNLLVVPVPDTSIPAAEGYAESLGLKHNQAIIKNRYIGRTFMAPGQMQRSEQLRRKHNIIPEAIDGKDIIMIDDSIVRLNTLPRLVDLAHSVGARSVSVLIASPPVRFPDYYGIDTPKQSELAAFNMTVEQMRGTIDCKYLGFLSLSGMIKATGLPDDMFNLSCFTGEYPIGIGHRKREISAPVSMKYVE